MPKGICVATSGGRGGGRKSESKQFVGAACVWLQRIGVQFKFVRVVERDSDVKAEPRCETRRDCAIGAKKNHVSAEEDVLDIAEPHCEWRKKERASIDGAAMVTRKKVCGLLLVLVGAALAASAAADSPNQKRSQKHWERLLRKPIRSSTAAPTTTAASSTG